MELAISDHDLPVLLLAKPGVSIGGPGFIFVVNCLILQMNIFLYF